MWLWKKIKGEEEDETLQHEVTTRRQPSLRDRAVSVATSNPTAYDVSTSAGRPSLPSIQDTRSTRQSQQNPSIPPWSQQQRISSHHPQQHSQNSAAPPWSRHRKSSVPHQWPDDAPGVNKAVGQSAAWLQGQSTQMINHPMGPPPVPKHAMTPGLYTDPSFDNESEVVLRTKVHHAKNTVRASRDIQQQRKSSIDLAQTHLAPRPKSISLTTTKPIPVLGKTTVNFSNSTESPPSGLTPSGTPTGMATSEALASGRMYVALHDYDARTENDLSIRKHEHLEVLDMPSDDWWYARSQQTGDKGYIPSNFVAKLKSLDAEEWFFSNINRAEAERRLLASSSDHGAFLIRNSDSRKHEFSLSVRDGDKVKHYRIRVLDRGGYFITRRDPFNSLHDLVALYTRDSGGLCTRLHKPCSKRERPDTVGLSYNMTDAWEISKEQVVLQQRLGAGQFGEVWAGLWNQAVKVAVKTLRPGKMNPDDFLAEANVLKKMRHPKLIQLYGICTREEPFYIITELMVNGALLEYLRAYGNPMSLHDMIDIAAQVSQGMSYLEQQNFIHRDLAARNVLVGEGNSVKVADFGLSRLVMEDEYQAHAGAKFPIKWTAPEALNYNKFTTKSDVWSFGVLLFEIITSGLTPYPSMSNAEVVNELERGYRMSQPSKCPDKLFNIMLECWAKDPIKRPTFETLQWKLDDYFYDDEQDYKEANMIS